MPFRCASHGSSFPLSYQKKAWHALVQPMLLLVLHLIHPDEKIAKMALVIKAMQLHFIYMPCVSVTVQCGSSPPILDSSFLLMTGNLEANLSFSSKGVQMDMEVCMTSRCSNSEYVKTGLICRYTLKLTCHMQLAQYPFDQQVCSMKIESCKYMDQYTGCLGVS